jgi:SNF2 family DNA or RNA helicase
MDEHPFITYMREEFDRLAKQHLSQAGEKRAARAVRVAELLGMKKREVNALVNDQIARALMLSDMPQARTPVELKRELTVHQKVALGRLLQWVDEKDVPGGIVADDMGMGKTLLMVALLMSRKPTPENPAVILVPAILLSEWYDTIKNWTRGYGLHLNVLMIHNTVKGATPTKALTMEMLKEHNVILASHHLLADEVRGKDARKNHAGLFMTVLRPS